MGSFELLIENLGSFGRYQKTFWILCGLAAVPCGYQNMLNVYIQATPPFRCNTTELYNLSVAEQMNITARSGEVETEGGLCGMMNLNYSEGQIANGNNLSVLINDENQSVKCENWSYDLQKYGTTIVTEWDLVCSRRWYIHMAQSMYMVGVVLGAILFGYISDRYGRRLSLCLALMSGAMFGSVSALMPEVGSHILMRMLLGVCVSGVNIVSCVLALELIGLNRRALPGITTSVALDFGFLLLTVVAYLSRNFQGTMLILGLLSIVYISYWCILPESPRWLLAKGKVSEAKKELSRAARMNGVSTDVDQFVEDYMKTSNVDDSNYTSLDLFQRRALRGTNLVVMYIWFATIGTFYGISLLYRELIVDIYVNSVMIAILHVILAIPLFCIVQHVRRRVLLASLGLIAGTSLLLSLFSSNDHSAFRITLITMGQLSCQLCLTTLYFHIPELFPTVIRNIALGSGFAAGHIGAAISPFVNELSYVWEPFPRLVYAILLVTAGILSLFLRETVGEPLQDLIQEMDYLRGPGFNSSRSFKRSDDIETHSLLASELTNNKRD